MKKQLEQLMGKGNENSWMMSRAGIVASYCLRNEGGGTSLIEMMLEPLMNTN